MSTDNLNTLSLQDKLTRSFYQGLQQDIKISKGLLLIDGLMVALNTAVEELLLHEHNNPHIKSLRTYLEAVIDETNYKLDNKEPL